MEEQNQNEESPLFGLTIDPMIRSHLSETARWAKFLSIIGFIGCGLIVLLGIFLSVNFDSLQRRNSYDNGTQVFAGLGAVVGFVYIIGALLYFFPCLFLFRFSNKMKASLASENQESLTVAFQNLKILYRFKGILTIIVLSLYLLVFLFGGLGMLLGR